MISSNSYPDLDLFKWQDVHSSLLRGLAARFGEHYPAPHSRDLCSLQQQSRCKTKRVLMSRAHTTDTALGVWPQTCVVIKSQAHGTYLCTLDSDVVIPHGDPLTNAQWGAFGSVFTVKFSWLNAWSTACVWVKYYAGLCYLQLHLLT